MDMSLDSRENFPEIGGRTEVAGLSTGVLTTLLETGRRKDGTALEQIANLTRDSMGSVVCSITQVNVERRFFKAVATAGIPRDKEKLIRTKEFLLSSLPGGFDHELITQGAEIEKYRLDADGQGVVKTDAAATHRIHSLLAVPLEVQDRFWGYINHFSNQRTDFRPEQKRLLRMFARFAEVAIEKLDQVDLKVLTQFTQWLLHPSGDRSQLCQQVCEIMKAPVGVLWELDDKNPRFLCVSATTSGVDESVRRIKIDLNKHQGLKRHLNSRNIGCLTDVRKPDPRYEHSSLASQFGWISLLTKSLYAGERVIGMLDIYSTGEERRFAEWEIHLFDMVGNQLAMYLQWAALRRAFLEDISHATSDPVNRERIARDYSEIAGAEYGCLYFFNPETQQLESQAEWSSHDIPKVYLPTPLELGNGISGLAALGRETIYIKDTQEMSDAMAEPGRSVLAIPMSIDQDLFGVFTFGSRLPNAFKHTRMPCETLLREVPPIIARIHGREMLKKLTQLAAKAQTCKVYLEELSKLLLLLMRASGSVIWKFDKDQNEFRPQFVNYPGYPERRSMQAAFSRDDVKDSSSFDPQFPSPLQFPHRLAVPVVVDGRMVYILEVGSDKPMESHRRSLLDSLAEQASGGIKNIGRKEALECLNEAFRKIAAAVSADQVMDIVLESALSITQTRYRSISKLDLITEKLLMVKYSLSPETGSGELQIGQGLIGYALKQLQPVRVDDVSQRHDYCPFWKNIKSELAVPMFVDAAKIRVDAKLEPARRPIGVINVESPSYAAFTAFEEECLVALASHAAAVLDKLDFEEKLLRLHNADASLTALVAANEDWDKVADSVLDAIIQTFGYPHVSLSLVTTEGKRIKTEKVRGTWLHSAAEAQAFARATDYPLNSNCIQADVVRDKQIIVPSSNSSRFDHKTDTRFRMDQLVRVYIPIMLNGAVIGAVEAGQPKRFQKHIYERDIQLLNIFVTYASEAIGRRRHGILDQFSHDFKAAVQNIQLNTEYLQQSRAQLPDDTVELKLNDVMADCEILRYQIDHLEYFLRGRSSTPWPGLTHIGRDVIMKTIKQMGVLIRQDGLSSQIVFDYERFRQIRIQTDKTLLCQVMTNVFINAIKYRDLEKKRLRMEIDIQNRGEFYAIRIRDWGMGVEQGLEEKIFVEGFRAPQARQRVQGTGYGLSMSRQIMRSLGGELKLSRSSNPTEFEVIVPKRLKGKP
jgi:GAF domain-containing protein